MRKYIPAFELKDSVLKKALSFGSIATLGTMQSGDLLTDETEELNGVEEIASYIVSDGKGILAADESNPTCGKRFDTIGVESTESNRRDYREMLFRASGIEGNIGGVILFDETVS